MAVRDDAMGLFRILPAGIPGPGMADRMMLKLEGTCSAINSKRCSEARVRVNGLLAQM
jgi:hypothetical protein